MAAAFWLLSGVQRVGIASPDASRYLYVGGLFVLLLAVELLRGVRVGRGSRFFVMAASAVVAVSATSATCAPGARYLRAQAPVGARRPRRARARAGAASRRAITRSTSPACRSSRSTPRSTSPPRPARLARLHACAQLATRTEHEARFAADGELANIEASCRAEHRRAGSAPPRRRRRPRRPGALGRLRALPRRRRALPRVAAAELQITVPLAGLRLTAEGVPAQSRSGASRSRSRGER